MLKQLNFSHFLDRNKSVQARSSKIPSNRINNTETILQKTEGAKEGIQQLQRKIRQKQLDQSQESTELYERDRRRLLYISSLFVFVFCYMINITDLRMKKAWRSGYLEQPAIHVHLLHNNNL